jgi:hypothetical protein
MKKKKVYPIVNSNIRIVEINIEKENSKLTFDTLTEDTIRNISLCIGAIKDFNISNDLNLPIENAIIFDNQELLLERIIPEIKDDYQQNIRDSCSQGFKFRYLITNSNLSPKALSITVELSDPNKKIGNIYYSLFVKKYKEKYYLWAFED